MMFIFWDFIISWVVSCGDYLCCWIYLMLRTWHLCWDVFDSAVTLCWRLFSCMTMLVINCRSDDYFFCIYLNCMIYCLIRNRALHRSLSLFFSFSNNHAVADGLICLRQFHIKSGHTDILSYNEGWE